MVIMRVHCGACGGVFEVYQKLREYDKARQCPHCEARIDGVTWREKILPAYIEVMAANLALSQDHVEYHTAPFEVDFIADTKFVNSRRVISNDADFTS